VAQQILDRSLHPKQNQSNFEEQISRTRKQMMATNTIQEIMNKQPGSARSISSDESLSDSDTSAKVDSSNAQILRKLNSKKDPLFFEFFSIYTAQSVNQQKLVTKRL
jgi:hypothetical protein